ncbi:MAG: RsmB/NOP family class I SAM-dependent RNA methyltransferase [Lentisphaeria bacterium]|nr:RsmB/NOP family class I SAM-dependent RNA methyltransferase [Lentisphaeria bacterium]
MQGTAGHILQTAIHGLEWTENGRSLDDFLDRTPENCRNSVGFVLFALFRNRKSIDRLLMQFVRKAPEKKIMALLEVTSAQIFYCKGIAGESAVNVAVDHCRKKIHPKAAGFVNAVLRKMTAQPVPDDFSPEAILPEPVLKHWLQIYTPETVSSLAEAFASRPEAVFRCTGNDLPDDAELAALQAEKLPEPFPGCPFQFCRTENLANVLNSPGWTSGKYYIQDPAAALAVTLADFSRVRRALDICAAPGGKSLMIAELMPPGGLLVAADRSENRQKLTRENFIRRGWDFPTPALPPEKLPDHWRDFDLVLADVPCSNTGVFRRRPDALWRFRENTLEDLRDLQLHLLEEAAKRVAPGGQLLYSTCSIDPEENAGRCAEFLAAHPEFKDGGGKQLYPTAAHDGAYAHLLKKVR